MATEINKPIGVIFFPYSTGFRPVTVVCFPRLGPLRL